jgi:uncharacterized protein DUF1553/uncharacterized protein DUF1549/cytochrome c
MGIVVKLHSLVAVVLLGSAAPLPADDKKAPEGSLTFESHVRPILKVYCFPCHGEGSDKPKGKLDVRLRRFLAKGGTSGPSIAPGKRADSLLYKRLVEGEMPPEEKKKPTKQEIETIGRWIDQGALTARDEPEKVADGPTREDLAFWSFQPIRRPELPNVAGRTPVDRFLLAALGAKGLAYSPEADKRALLRRATFDLTGLPPSLDEVDAFLADEAPDAYDRLIDRLLASPRYGERWGRHWLDVAGYADSEGYDERDAERKWSWRYRDYVVRSLNADKPFDRFITEQLAGDELLAPPYANLGPEAIEKLTATGYLRMAPDGTGSSNAEQVAARNQAVADTIKIVSTGLLGLTVGCAQCHNHRYDPIPQLDYYRIRAVFEPALDVQNWRTPDQRHVSLKTEEDRKKSAAIEAEAVKVDLEREKKQTEYIRATLEKELAKVVDEELREALRWAASVSSRERTPVQAQILKAHPSCNVSPSSLYLYDSKAADDLKKIAARAADIRAKKPVEEFLHALTEVPGTIPETRLFNRGDPAQPKEVVPPGGLSVLAAAAIPVKDPSTATTGRRLAFARWLTDGKHPLTARVLVNRVWMHHFGRGIVGTPADFGALGERPSHPELLDWLADDFMAHGWTLKRVHKLLMTSTAYRQVSRRDPRGESADPENRLLWRMNVHRLEAESIRDAMLAVSGQLNPKMFGAPVPVMADEVGQFVVGKENLDGEGKVGAPIPLNGEEFRRSLYVQARRSRMLSMLECFDSPVMEPNCELRSASTVAPQALLLMNNQFVLLQAAEFAKRVRRDAGDDPAAQVALAFRRTFGRAPTVAELKDATAFRAKKSDQALTRFCQALLASNEFLYVD